MKVICIDNSGRPESIPLSKWIVKGKEYTVIQVDKINMDPGVYGYKLEELNIDDCFPYLYFRSTRFSIPTEELELIEELEINLPVTEG